MRVLERYECFPRIPLKCVLSNSISTLRLPISSRFSRQSKPVESFPINQILDLGSPHHRNQTSRLNITRKHSSSPFPKHHFLIITPLISVATVNGNLTGMGNFQISPDPVVISRYPASLFTP